jgi:hypothetical protein
MSNSKEVGATENRRVRPEIHCPVSEGARGVYWGRGLDFSQDAQEESPVLSTVDQSFWSESEIESRRTKPLAADIQAGNCQMIQGDHSKTEVTVPAIVSVLPSMLGCPLPYSCFEW